MIDHWEQASDICCLKMIVLNCSIYQKFLKALVYKEAIQANLDSLVSRFTCNTRVIVDASSSPPVSRVKFLKQKPKIKSTSK